MADKGACVFDLDGKADTVTFVSAQQALDAIDAAEGKKAARELHLVLFGCRWCYPSWTSLVHAAEMFSSPPEGLKLHLVDEESERDFCDHKEIMVGSSVLFVAWRGKMLLFKRSDWPLNDRIVGPFNRKSLQSIVDATLKAIKAGKKNVSIDF